ncbi:LptF/LptG family permease [Stappia sp. 28M-7]|uniref:LptF/LptG family permease n=1 Tax=Stappia sp. 28M-7 TaxID=2762596 RepID=UPI00163BFC44|nr:LptF/LptG family permease [Stappia sp. 28M-7]
MRPLASLAARSLFARVLGRVVLVVAIIEVVFLAEKLTGILEEVLGNGGNLLYALAVLGLTSPEIFDFALALACVIGGYFAFVAAREERELVALSAAGVSWGLPVRVALSLGALAFLASLAVSGVIDPLARNATRTVIFQLKSELLFSRITGPSEGTLVETIRGRTFAALSDTSVAPPHESLFVHQPGEAGRWRVTQAADWKLAGPDEEGNYSLGLGRVIAYDFVRVETREGAGMLRQGRGPNLFAVGRPDVANIPALPQVKVENVSLPVSLDNILNHALRSDVAEEWTVFEALSEGQAAGETGREALKIAGERLSRAIAVFVAPLLALLACVFAGRGVFGFLSLPVACGALLAFDIVLRGALGRLAADQPQALAMVGLAAALLVLLVALAGIRARAAVLLRPVSSRA